MTTKKKATKTTKSNEKKSNPKDGANTARRRYELEVEAALDCEHRSQWAEAAAAWGRAQELAGDRGERKEAAGRKAAAKVRASAKTSKKSTPLDKQLAGNPTAGANAESWDQAIPEPGYVPPAGTGDDDAQGGDDARDNDDADDGAASNAGASTGEPVANDAAKSRRARKAAEAAAPRERDPRLPPVGSVIIKKDRQGNERARCTIVEGGVEYKGTTYKSLSGAGLQASKDLGLTTTTCDGLAFWGLKKGTPRAAKKNAVESLAKAWERYRERAASAAQITDETERAKVQAAIHQHVTALLALAGEANA